jgi:hypothetical protein
MVAEDDCGVRGTIVYPVIELFGRSGCLVVQVVDPCHEIAVKLVAYYEKK